MRRGFGSWAALLGGLFFFLLHSLAASAAGPKYPSRYGEYYCSLPEFGCTVIAGRSVEKTVKTKKGKTVTKVVKAAPKWEELWPDEAEREAVRKLNRTNWSLREKWTVAYPLSLAGKTYMDFSPLPLSIEPPGEKLILVDLAILAWGAYTPEGKLVNWGPIAGGRGGGYPTPAGNFRIYAKHGPNYRSSKYPEGCAENGGCAPMPWAMHFKPNYALHGGSLPGRHASHGCVRMYTEDAKWLNREFAEIRTAVRILPYFEGLPYKFRAPEVFAPAPPPVVAAAPAPPPGPANAEPPPSPPLDNSDPSAAEPGFFQRLAKALKELIRGKS